MKSIIKMLMAFMVLILFMTGCKYEVAEPLWEKDYTNPPTPVITRLDPDSVAPAGVNYITIYGEDFAESLADNQVYFGNVAAEIVDGSTSFITVRRPNLVGDSIIVKLVSYDALIVAKYGPYRIDPVMERYGSFLDNAQLRALDVDADGNLYVIQVAPSILYKIPPDGGEKEIVRETGGVAYDAKVGPDGKLVVVMGSRIISQIDLLTADSTKFAEAPKTVRYGDFDSYGNFYVVSNSRSDLYFVASGDTVATSPGLYNDGFFDVEVFQDGVNEYVYLLVELRSPNAGEPGIAIWRHRILDANGTLGERELVLDWSQTGEFAESNPATFAVAKDSDGTIIYVGTDHTDPILIFDPDKNSQDILYKGIIPTEAVHLVYDAVNHYIYMLLGGDEWNVLRIDMGEG